MKASEKKTLYVMLKKTSAAFLGYDSPCFEAEPDFFDDDDAPVLGRGLAVEKQIDGGVKINFQSQDALQEQKQDFVFCATIESIAKKIAMCKRCPLCGQRKNVVPGEGNPSPLVLVIGEGPGEEEDESGRPFVGPAGRLLDKMLGAIALSRNKNCFISNIVKCRPPHNRDPEKQEAAACRSFLDAQIHVLKPKMILAMGRVALQNILDTSIGINKMRGKFVDFKGIPFMPTYHPSALLRDESLKRPAWEDLKAFRQKLLELAPDYDK